MRRELLAPGLWRLEVSHPEWSKAKGGPGGWEPQVAWHLLQAPEATVLIDPLVVDPGGGKVFAPVPDDEGEDEARRELQQALAAPSWSRTRAW